MISTNPRAHPPFRCSICGDVELPPRADHPILPGGAVLCRDCLIAYDGEIEVFAPNRAAAVAALSHMTPVTPTEGA